MVHNTTAWVSDIMQIDFHHATTYVVARYAGFNHHESEIIAYCSQYVDDATNEGTIRFDTGAMYTRISSAHKKLDHKHFDKLANRYIWIPFHFLPGNGGHPAGEDPTGGLVEKLICRPDSHIARDMVAACIANQDKPYSLHRLGITMHVYADTWAHQGFAGITNDVNDIRELDEIGQESGAFLDKLKDAFQERFDRAASRFVGNTMPMGHIAAFDYPDLPYLRWTYKQRDGHAVERNNTKEFTTAAENMCVVMQRYRTGSARANVPGLSSSQREKIASVLATASDEDGKARHKQWLRLISDGYFEFPPVKLTYRDKNLGSWKHQALGTRRSIDRRSDIFPYDPSFLRSDWKLFHDALMAHRFYIIHELLPKYGICAA